MTDHTVISKIRKIYRKFFEFPEWVCQTLSDNDNYLETTTVYYPEHSDLNIIEKLATQREPTNMDYNRLYHEDVLEKEFGWKTSYYQQHWDSCGTIPPNIGIYCKTPVVTKDGRLPDAHIYHAVGAALDNKNQPDFKHFTVHKDVWLMKFYDTLFHMIYTCAEQKGFKTVVMSGVGANNFASLYPGGPDKFQENIWCPVFEENFLKHPSIETVFMGTTRSRICSCMHEKGYDIPDVGFFPNILCRDDINP